MYHQTQTASREEFKFLCVIVLLFFIHYNVYLLGHRIQLMPVSDYMGINWFLSSQTSINLLIYNRLNTAYLCKFDQQCRISLHINMAVDGAHCTVWWDESSDLALQVIALLQVSSHCAGCAHPPRKLINVTSYIIHQFMINDLTCHPSSLSYFCSNEAWKYTETLWIEILLYPKEQSWMNPTHTTWSCK